MGRGSGGGRFSGGGGSFSVNGGVRVGIARSGVDHEVRMAGACATLYAPKYKECDVPILYDIHHPDHWKTVKKYYPDFSLHHRLHPEARWSYALKKALTSCPKNMVAPEKLDRRKHQMCHFFMEMLVDCPPGYLDGHNLPPLSSLGESVRIWPLELRDPMSACRMWKTTLERCRAKYSNFDSEWRCVPFEGFVEDHCRGEKTDSSPPATA